jgi:hypothetical protein
MSWDIILFNSKQTISSPENIESEQLVPISFVNLLRTYFKNIEKDGDHYSINEEKYSIAYFDNGELVSNKILHLYGEEAIYAIIHFASQNNLQIFDTGLEQMINLHDPQKNGYENFQGYLNQVLNK